MCSLVVRTPQLSIAVRFGKSEDNACQPDAFWVYFVICVLLLSEIGLNLLLEDMFKKPQQSPVAYALRVCACVLMVFLIGKSSIIQLYIIREIKR